MVTCGLRLIVSGSSTPSLMTALVLPHLDTEEDAFEADGGSQGDHAPTHSSSLSTPIQRRVFIGRQRPKTPTTSFGFTAQTRRLRQPRPAAAAAADQNSSKSGQWGR